MGHRERAAYREYMAAESAREREEQQAEQEHKDAKVREASQQHQELINQIYQTQRQNIMQGQRDADFKVDPAVADVRMSRADAAEFNSNAVDSFMVSTPAYYPCEANEERLIQYLQSNGIEVFNAATLRNAFDRLVYYDLLVPRPPEPLTAAPDRPANVNLNFADSEPTAPQQEPIQEAAPDGSELGVDPETNQPRRYSLWEINQMDSGTYRRCFKLRRLWPEIGWSTRSDRY